MAVLKKSGGIVARSRMVHKHTTFKIRWAGLPQCSFWDLISEYQLILKAFAEAASMSGYLSGFMLHSGDNLEAEQSAF